MIYDEKQIGQRIKKARNELKISQGKLAEMLGMSESSRQTVTKWEKGEMIPNGYHLIELCKIFDCEIGYLFGEFECKTKKDSDVLKATGLLPKASSVLYRLNYKNEWETNRKCAWKMKDREKITLMNLVLENEEFWKDFMGCFSRYCREKHRSKYNIEYSYQTNELKELEVIRYSMVKIFDRMVDDLYKTIHIPRAKKLFDPAKEAKKNDGATKSAPPSE